MSEDIKVTDGTVLEALNNKVDLDGGNYIGSGLDKIIHEHCSSSGFSLFDIVQKDHVLTFEESKGLAMLGSYVYKNGVAGSRYGYADFYEKCLDEYKNSTSSKVYLKSNVNYVGSVKDDKGVLSGFSESNCATVTNGRLNNSEYVVKFTTGSDVSTTQAIFHAQKLLNLEMKSGKFSTYNWGTTKDVSFFTAVANTTYWFKVNVLDNTRTYEYSTDGKTYTQLSTITDSAMTVNEDYVFTFGLSSSSASSPFAGSIDLNESYINVNGERYWSGVDYFNYSKNSSGHQFYDIANKAGADYLFKQRGESMFYGVDEENERIFLPRRTRTQATMNLDEVNEFIEAGLPDHTHTVTAQSNAGSSWGTNKPGWGNDDAWRNQYSTATTSKASASNPIYGNSDTVQPPASLVLEYMVVGNVNVDKAQTDVTEITTSENDTLPLFHNLYSKEDMTTTGAYINASEGGWHDGNVYTTAYNELVNKLGTDNVKPVTDTFTDYDFVVNQDDMTFRLPLLNGSEDLPADKVVAFAPSASGDKFTAPANGWFIGHIIATSATKPTNIQLKNDLTGYRDVSNTYGSDSYSATAKVFCKKDDVITMSWGANSTSPVLQFVYAKGNGNLYYKVANAVTNLELLDVAKIESTKADKTAVDGQWVFYNTETFLFSKVNFVSNTPQSFSLADILPNDGYNYEVIINLIAYTSTTSGNTANFYATTDLCPNNQYAWVLGREKTQASNRTSVAGNANIVVGNARTLIVLNSGSGNGEADITICGYRRLGTNQ